jgi:hypothetical protein
MGACERRERFGVGFKEEQVRRRLGEMVHVMAGHLPFSCQDEKAKSPIEQGMRVRWVWKSGVLVKWRWNEREM